MATVGSAIVCDHLRLYGNSSLCDRLRSAIRNRLRSSAIIWKPAYRTWFYLLRSRSQDRRRSQTIAEVCFHMIADDRRTFCDLRSSAIIWKPALNSGANLACDARLDIHALGFWERQKSTFFDIRVCHPNADSYKDLPPEQVYRLHENEKKRIKF